jgi:Trk K+ transport system NAD-binding subunit
VNPEVAEFLDDVTSTDRDIAMTSIVVDPESVIVGCALGDYGRNVAPHVSFVALRRGDAPPLIPPAGSEELRAGDRLIVAGAPVEIRRMREDAQRPEQARPAA